MPTYSSKGISILYCTNLEQLDSLDISRSDPGRRVSFISFVGGFKVFLGEMDIVLHGQGALCPSSRANYKLNRERESMSMCDVEKREERKSF